MKNILSDFIYLLSLHTAQTELMDPKLVLKYMVGASNLGGTFSLGLKYAAIINENFAVGPSFRLTQDFGINNLGVSTSANIWGGGIWAHARYKNALFGGVEFELIKIPIIQIGWSSANGNGHPLFIGGGFSKEYNQKIRINLGIFYDVINAENSPFRSSYTIRIKDSQTGQVQKILPIIYRINFFFPIGNKSKEK